MVVIGVVEVIVGVGEVGGVGVVGGVFAPNARTHARGTGPELDELCDSKKEAIIATGNASSSCPQVITALRSTRLRRPYISPDT